MTCIQISDSHGCGVRIPAMTVVFLYALTSNVQFGICIVVNMTCNDISAIHWRGI